MDYAFGFCPVGIALHRVRSWPALPFQQIYNRYSRIRTDQEICRSSLRLCSVCFSRLRMCECPQPACNHFPAATSKINPNAVSHNISGCSGMQMTFNLESEASRRIYGDPNVAKMVRISGPTTPERHAQKSTLGGYGSVAKRFVEPHAERERISVQ